MTVLAAAEPRNLEAIAVLLKEMDAFYGVTEFDPLETRVRQIDEALFGKMPAGYALLAWQDEALVGFASYSYLWPAVGLTRSLFLKELYVAQDRRSTGIGKQLMHRLFDLAAEQGCSRVEWQTDTYNQDAQAFYATLGVEVDASKVFYRLQGDRLSRTAE